MQICVDGMRERFVRAQGGHSTSHQPERRTAPRVWQYDYPVLVSLAHAMKALVRQLPVVNAGTALDLGSSVSPYRKLIEAAGYTMLTLDLTLEHGADVLGSAEHTGLGEEAFDLVLCTQVLEHCDDPWKAMAEIRRVLRPGGHAIVTVPHVWFYHPQPHDNWRFTQEGIVRLAMAARLEVVELRAQGGTVLTLAQILNFVLYGVIGRVGAPLYACISLCGLIADRLAPNELFCQNFAVLLVRK